MRAPNVWSSCTRVQEWPRTPPWTRHGRPMCDHPMRVCRNGPEHPHEPDMGAQCVIILCDVCRNGPEHPHEPEMGAQCVIILCACAGMAPNTPMNQPFLHTSHRMITHWAPMSGSWGCSGPFLHTRIGWSHIGRPCLVHGGVRGDGRPMCDHPVCVCGNVGLLLPPLNALRDQSRYVRVTIGCTCESALPSRLTPFQPSFS